MTTRRASNGKRMIDVKYRHVCGRVERVQRVSPVQTKRGADRFEREVRDALQAGTYGKGAKQEKKEESIPIPKLAEFAEEFIRGHSIAGQLKPETIVSQRSILRKHVIPTLGHVRMDAVGTASFAKLRASLAEKQPKTINNVLGVLSRMVRCWYEWQDLPPPRFKVGLVKVPHKEADFYGFDEYDKLVAASSAVGPQELVIVLLGGDAGLRMGEMRALCWHDLRLAADRPVVTVARSRYRDEEHAPKGGKSRVIPLTRALQQALAQLPRSLHEPHLLVDDGQPLTRKATKVRLQRAQRRAGLEPHGRLHILRHTFCSHLAMRGVPMRTIQELAGHAELTTTMRYSHLVPDAKDDAIRALEGKNRGSVVGSESETGS